MKKATWKNGLAAMLGLVLSIQAPLGAPFLRGSAYAYTERAATVSASSLNVRSGAGTTYSQVAKLSQGAAVTVTGETTASDGKLWYQIRFSGGTGYVLSTYVKFPVTYSHDGDFEAQLSAQGFPESYKDGLRQLHARYPNWTFTAQKTGLDWNTVIQNENTLGRSLVHKDSISSYKSIADGAYNWDNGTWTGFDGSTWVAASQEILSYYMDPRNFLDEPYIFQFLSQEYNPAIHTREGVVEMLKGTFMEGSVPGGASSPSAPSGGGTGTVVGPGGSGVVVSPGTSGNSGNTGATGGSGDGGSVGTGSAPGGQAAVLAPPGGQGGAAGSQDSSQDGGSAGATQQAPAVDNGGAKLQGPQASISKHNTELVATSNVVTAGPGGASGNNGGGAVLSPGSGASSSGAGQGTSNINYADVIMKAAAASGVNPYVLAAMIMQEQGRDGHGNSIVGNYAGYVGYYNYFNVGSYASDGMEAVERGLWYASQSGSYGRPWDSVEKSILGGAEFYGTNYVSAGQDTLYLKKYNVQGSNMYKHQYMTNVDGAAAEGALYAEGYTESLKATALNFKIPVYNNMPEQPCAKPTVDGSPNNKLGGLGVEGFALTPTFSKDTASYNLIVDYSVSNVTVNASAIDSKATVSGAGSVQLQSGDNQIPVVVRAQNGTERTYTIHVVRQNNGPTYNAGIGGGTGGAASPGGTAGGSGPSGGSAIVIEGPGGSSGGGSGSSGGGSGGTSSTPGIGNAPGSGVPSVGSAPGSDGSGSGSVTIVGPTN